MHEIIRAYLNGGGNGNNIVIVLRPGLHTLLQQVVADLPRYGVAGEVGQAKGEDGNQQHLNQILPDNSRFPDTHGQEYADLMDAGLCPKGQYQGQNDGADNDNHHQQGHDQFIQRSQRSGGVFVGFIVHLHGKGFPVNSRQGLDFGHHPRHVLRVVYGNVERGKAVVDLPAVKFF